VSNTANMNYLRILAVTFCSLCMVLMTESVRQDQHEGDAECVDKETHKSKCKFWTSRGYCKKDFVEFMKLYCCSTCSGETVNGGWGPWTELDACSKACGVGRRRVSRLCNNPPPANGGRNCVGTTTKSQTCNLGECGGPGNKTSSECLLLANSFREKHVNTPALKWDAALASEAQAYANELMDDAQRNGGKGRILRHDPNRGKETGENLWHTDQYLTGNDTYYCKEADKSWYGEIKDYNYKTAFSKNENDVGYFTQMVWKETTSVGYGVAVSSSPRYAGNKMAIVVARYQPQGNNYDIGKRFQDYSRNVQPLA